MSASAPPLSPHQPTALLRQALSVLGVRRLVLAIHDQSFPSTDDEDIDRGSPYGEGAAALFGFVAALGFDGVQLGPQGDTSLDNPSPYDGALFTKSPLSIAVQTLAREPDWAPLCDGLLSSNRANARVPGPSSSDRVRYIEAWHTARRLVAELHTRFDADRVPGGSLAVRFAAFRQRWGPILTADGVFEAFTQEHGTDDWRRWPTGARDGSLWTGSVADQAAFGEQSGGTRHSSQELVERHAFGQFVLAEQHQRLRDRLAAAPQPLLLYGDLPIGFSHRDLWSRGRLFRRDYLLGAPPSRTNPEGQPWGFPVLDPDQYFAAGPGRVPGPVLELLMARVDKLLGDFDGLRIDHPHGLVCPWVYAADQPDPTAAVGRGARLFCSPNLPDHPGLARLAIPTADQLSRDPGIARYADDWVRELGDEQVGAYGTLFDALMSRVAATGRQVGDVVCEVLSTWPYPLRRVMDRYGLGRFCVLQKADLTRPDDVYRAENAAPRDWIMLGNHDTRPIWLLADSWHGTAAGTQWATYLAERLLPGTTGQARLAHWIAADARHCCHAMFALLFVSPARQVSVFFPDLFGLRETYNRPGIVDDGNWTLRLPPDWYPRHQARLRQLSALNVPLALCLALRGRPSVPDGLLGNLLQAARQQTPTLDQEIVSLLMDADLAPADVDRPVA